MNSVSKQTKIYIGGLPDSCSAEDLRNAFEKHGKVEECDIIKNFGFVHMGDETEARAAIEALNGAEFMGVKITVEASRSKVRPKPGMGGKGQCYRCGKSGHWSKECPRNTHDRHNHNGRAPHPPPPPPPPQMPPPGPAGWYGGRYGPVRNYPVDRGYDRAYSRPYPDLYDRRPPPPPPREEYYYRRPYLEEYAYRRSPSNTDRTYGAERSYYTDDTQSFASYSSTGTTSASSGLYPPIIGIAPQSSNSSAVTSSSDMRRPI
ncbi:RNA-binding protein lark [Tetranychus urticae]|uniref:CCHC-type domain-containing protein n=1 Tax=Tetranychus urticae TaxID=32264 RepID=T1JXA0_TETUR|nr:RNA-binding protein lark [Tetranychus urticae]